jgi:hypothetical protein
MSKYIDLGKKLKALADKGIGGEKVNAQKMLEALMNKHNITIEQIAEEEVNEYYFKVSKSEFNLWYQIVRRVNYSIIIYGSFPQKMIKQYGFAGNYMIKANPCEYIEIQAKHDFYKRLLDSEYDLFYTAFLGVNDLLVSNPDKEDQDLSEEEMKKLIRTKRMEESIKKGEFLKTLAE